MSNILATAFLALSAHCCGDMARILLVAESKGNKGWGAIARSADPAQKRIQVSYRNPESAKILD